MKFPVKREETMLSRVVKREAAAILSSYSHLWNAESDLYTPIGFGLARDYFWKLG